MSKVEGRIGWLASTGISRAENIITDATGNEVKLTPQELQIIKDIGRQSTIEELMGWLEVESIEEAEAFLAEIDTDEAG